MPQVLNMQRFKKTRSSFGLVVAIVILASPLVAQQRRTAPPKKPAVAVVPEPAPTFDTLLSTETYKVYTEVRGVGALMRSSAIQDLLDPVMKLASPPKEFKTLVKWLNAHSDALAGSRMLVASWPSKLNIPNIFIAVEFSNPEEAQKFERELRGFVPTLLPTPTPTPAPKPASPTASGRPNISASASEEKESEPSLPPYQIKQSGSLVLMADKPIEFRKLRPRGSKLLEEDPNFGLARNRFSSEPLFLYVDVKSIEKEEQDRRQKWEEEQRRLESVPSAPKAEDSSGQTNSRVTVQSSLEVSTPEPLPQEAPIPPGSPQIAFGTTSANSGTLRGVDGSSAADSANTREMEEMSGAFYSLYGALFGGQQNWPEAVSAAIAFEGDAYVVRALVGSGAENKPSAIPFVPQFISGPPLVSQAASVFPADTALFVTASLDYPQIYDGMVKAIANAEELAKKYGRQPAGAHEPPEHSQPPSPFAVYEKKLGIKIKDDVLPLLGNELAFALPRTAPVVTDANVDAAKPGAERIGPRDSRASEPNPIIAIAIKDREAVRRLIPKLVEAFAFKGANLFAQAEKRDDTEIISYAGVLSYAFVGDFLVLSPDAAATHRVVDSYLSQQTLGSDSRFRNSTRWQARQLLGTIYVAPDVLERYFPFGGNAGLTANEKTREYLAQLNPIIDPITYSLSNDGLGPLHELHVPKTLLMLMIAGVSNVGSQTPLITNEAIAMSMMRTVVSAEATFQATEGAGRYGSLEELLSAGLISKEVIHKYGYKIEVTASSNKFEATAVPVEYGKTGRLSYFVDDSGVVRGGDHGGGAATIADKEIE
jgi:uncharacterized protein DUF3352